jgi:hypothetical protein
MGYKPVDKYIFRCKPLLESATFGVLNTYVENFSKGLNATVVYVDACSSLEIDKMAKAFWMNGAKSYLGWNKSVIAFNTDNVAERFFSNLLQCNTVETSFNALPFDFSSADLEWYGNGDAKLPICEDPISDTTAPSVPTDLTATVISSSQINLSWNASSDNIGVAGYKVYDWTGAVLRTVTTTATSVSELLPTSTYCFTVSAFDAANNESAKSLQACATTFSGVSNAPDLLITSLSAPTTGTIGDQITMSVDVLNQGSVYAGPFHVAFYFSSDSYIDINDTFSGWMCEIPGLNAGSTWNCSGSIGVASALIPGLYYFGAIADDLGQITETNEGNNARAADTGLINLTTGSPPGTVDVSGCWTLYMTDGIEGNTFYLDLVQSGNTLSGTMTLATDQSVQLTLSGSINGSTITFVAAQVISFTGSVNGNTISGTWANPSLQRNGTWSASRTCNELFIYASSGFDFNNGPSYLYKISPSPNGVDNKVGLIATIQDERPIIGDLALTPDGNLYGVSRDRLYLIDTVSAIASPIGSRINYLVNSLTSDINGNLYGATRDSGYLLKIDRNSAATTYIGQLGSGYFSSGDLAFSPEGILYATVRNLNMEYDLLVTVNLSTGEATRINSSIDSGVARVFGLRFIGNKLYGLSADSDGGGSLWIFDLNNGQANFVRNLQFQAFGAASVEK